MAHMGCQTTWFGLHVPGTATLAQVPSHGLLGRLPSICACIFMCTVAGAPPKCMHVYVCMCVYICIYIYIYTYIYIYKYIYIYITYKRMCVHAHFGITALCTQRTCAKSSNQIEFNSEDYRSTRDARLRSHAPPYSNILFALVQICWQVSRMRACGMCEQTGSGHA
jgi:hypothetical protein